MPAAGSCKTGKLRADSWPRAEKLRELAARIGRELAAVERMLNINGENIYEREAAAAVADPAGEAIQYGTAGSSAAQRLSRCGYGEKTPRC